LKGLLKLVGVMVAELCAAPVWLATQAGMAMANDPDRVLAWSSQMISVWPGPLGEYVRRAVYARVLDRCEPDVCICFGTVLSRRQARIGNRTYVGVGCNLGLVDLEDDVLIGSGVHLLSGKRQHHFDRVDIPIREQGGEFNFIRIGRGTWIGNAAVVLANVGAGCVVGAGSVVINPVPDGSIVGGNPARVLAQREGLTPEDTASPSPSPSEKSASERMSSP